MNDVANKSGMSKGTKIGLGIGIGCLTLILLVIAAGVVGWCVLRGKVRTTAAELAQYGFHKTVQTQIIEVKDPITEPTIYIGQLVKIYADCPTNLAIIAQMAEIHGRVAGKLYFRGQMLIIEPKAELLGGLDANAQMIQKLGKIEGEITGKFPKLSDSAQQPKP